MNLMKLYEKYITKEAIVDMLTKYELYYQISLGNYVFETLQDIDESIKKINDLNLKPSSSVMLANYIETLLGFSPQDEFEDKLNLMMRKKALVHSLKDFVTNDKELLNSKDYIEQKNEQINNDTLFTQQMKLQLESEYPVVYDEFDFLVNGELIEGLRHNLNYE